MKKRFFIVALVLIFSSHTYAQPSDSLYQVLDTARNQVRVNTLNLLAKKQIHNQPKKALTHTRTALELSIKLDYKHGIATCYNNLGVLYKNQGVYDKALKYYVKSLEINELKGNDKGVLLTKANIGNIYSLKGNHGKALEYFNNTYSELKNTNNKSEIVGLLNNIGNVYLSIGDQDNALSYFIQAVNMYNELGKKSEAFDPLTSLGNIYFYKEEYDKAIEYYTRSLLISQESNNILSQAYAQNNIGVTYFKKNDLTNAEKHENIALSIATQINAQPLLMDVYKALSDTYYAQRRLEEAYQSRVLYDQSKDLVNNQESNRKLARLEVAFELQQHEKEIEIAKKESTISQLEDQENRKFIIIVIMGSMLFLAFLFIYFSVKNKKFLKR